AGVEACDDGNADDTDDCPSSCEPARKGDGFVHAGVEQCDDGNLDDADACTNDGRLARCGDGIVHTGVEPCEPLLTPDGSCDPVTCLLPDGTPPVFPADARMVATGIPDGIRLSLANAQRASDDRGSVRYTLSVGTPCAANDWDVTGLDTVDTLHWYGVSYDLGLFDPAVATTFWLCAIDEAGNVSRTSIDGRPKDMCLESNGGCGALDCRNRQGTAEPGDASEECGDWTPPSFPAGAQLVTEPVPDGIRLTLPLMATDRLSPNVVYTVQATPGVTPEPCGTSATYVWVLPAPESPAMLEVDTNHWFTGDAWYPDGYSLYAYDPSLPWAFRLCAWDRFDVTTYEVGNVVSLAATDHAMDMCAVDKGGCDALAEYCRNAFGGRTWDAAASRWVGHEVCGSCPNATGQRNGRNLYFGFSGNGSQCVPADWCDWGGHNGGCDPISTCLNRTVTSRTQVADNDLSGYVNCTCPDGFSTTDDGLTCFDVDECASTDPPSCQAFSTCRNLEGSYTCECDDAHPFGDGNPGAEGCTATPTEGARVGRAHNGVLFEFSYVPRPPANASTGATTFRMGSEYPSGVRVDSNGYLACSDMSDEQCETHSFGTEGECNYVRDTWWTEGPQHDREIDAAMLVARTETTQQQWWANVRETLIQDGSGSYRWLATPATNPSNWAVEKPLSGQTPLASASRTFGEARLERRRYPVESMGLYGAIQFSNRLSESASLPPAYSVGADGRSSYAPADFMPDPEAVEGYWKTLRDSSDRFFSHGGTGYRLTTEAEWEYVARAGNTGYRYGSADAVSWHVGNSGFEPHRTGLKLPNAWGLHDVLGNVAEWTTTHDMEIRPYCFGSPTCFYYVGGLGSCSFDGDKYSISADIWDHDIERGLNPSYFAVERLGNFRVRGGYYGYWSAYARFGYRGNTGTADQGGILEYGRLRAYGSGENGFRLVRNLCPAGTTWTVADGAGSCR
ncbi:MAG: hypothetical protein RL199_1899, partial [Pseudomonadota bacterium]